jgi:hypothetical protein
MSSESVTTVQITKTNAKYLKLISEFADVSQTDIINSFIVQLQKAFRFKMIESLKTGSFISYETEIKAFPRPDLVSGTYHIAEDVSQEEEDAINEKLCNEAFEALDNKKALNKIKFASLLEKVSQGA